MEGKKEYQSLSSQIAALSANTTALNLALIAVKSGDNTKTPEKDVLLGKVKKDLDKIADGLDAMADDDTMLIFNAGFSCQTASRRILTKITGVPVIENLKSTGTQGEVAIKMQKLEGLRHFAFEHSSDNGVTWKNGQYSSRLTTVLTVDPHSEIMVRAYALGAGDFKSNASETLVCRCL
jgi:hypothetical protein